MPGLPGRAGDGSRGCVVTAIRPRRSHYAEADILHARFALPHGLTNRYVRVSYLSATSDRLGFVGVDGAEVDLPLVDWEFATDEECEQFEECEAEIKAGKKEVA